MKIQCDVCNRDEASVFCSADEAALCNACDHRVHHANKLASKHHRFSLLHPSPKQFPLCDICQEKRAFVFCQQDRAILCRDCDVQIHKANEHTKKHNRFLLTGVKLSATSELYIPTTTTTAAAATATATGDDSLTNGCDSSSAVPGSKSQPSTPKKPPVSDSSSSQIYHPPSMSIETTTSTTSTTMNNNNNNHPPLKGGDVGSTSSISEYLIETLPGWHVEDFLDSSSAPFGFCKTGGDGVMSFTEDADFGSNLSCFSSENIGVWVPQAPSSLTQDDFNQYSSYMNGNSSVGFKESKEVATINMKVAAANKRWCDDAFTVPQISPPSTTTASSKRCRTFW